MTRLLAGLLVALLAGPARSDPAPQPPPDHPPRVVEAGSTIQVRPLDDAGGPPVDLHVGLAGGVYLDVEASGYQVELRRWHAVERQACQDLLDAKPPPGLVWVAGAALVGLVAGYYAARALQ